MFEAILAYIKANLLVVSVSTVTVVTVAGAGFAVVNLINEDSEDATATIVDNRTGSSQSSFSNPLDPNSIQPRYNSTICAQGSVFINGRCQ